MSKKRKQIVLHPEELKKGIKESKELGLSFSGYIGQLIRNFKNK